MRTRPRNVPGLTQASFLGHDFLHEGSELCLSATCRHIRGSCEACASMVLVLCFFLQRWASGGLAHCQLQILRPRQAAFSTSIIAYALHSVVIHPCMAVKVETLSRPARRTDKRIVQLPESSWMCLGPEPSRDLVQRAPPFFPSQTLQFLESQGASVGSCTQTSFWEKLRRFARAFGHDLDLGVAGWRE